MHKASASVRARPLKASTRACVRACVHKLPTEAARAQGAGQGGGGGNTSVRCYHACLPARRGGWDGRAGRQAGMVAASTGVRAPPQVCRLAGAAGRAHLRDVAAHRVVQRLSRLRVLQPPLQRHLGVHRLAKGEVEALEVGDGDGGRHAQHCVRARMGHTRGGAEEARSRRHAASRHIAARARYVAAHMPAQSLAGSAQA